MAARVGSRVLLPDPFAQHVERGLPLGPQLVRVVEALPGGLYRVEGEDGVRWLVGREDIIRVA
jgi:hypothetical protein